MPKIAAAKKKETKPLTEEELEQVDALNVVFCNM